MNISQLARGEPDAVMLLDDGSRPVERAGTSETAEPRARGVSGPARRALGVNMLATLWFVSLAVGATAPALFGSRSLGPESVLDADPLYSQGDPAPPPAIFDRSRISYDVPREFATAEGVRHGRIDLWNPRAGFGMPLWTEGGGLFFPTKLIFYLAPSRRTYDVVAALRLVIAGLGAYLLARRRGLAPVPALAAGSLFELSGAMVSTLQFGELTPPCLLPWVVLGAELIAQQRRAAGAAASGLALGLTANSGHPMFVVVAFVGFGAAVIGHMLAAWRRPRTALTIGALAALAVLLGLVVATPAFLPLLEALKAGRLYKSTLTYAVQLEWYRDQTRSALPIALFAPATLEGLRAKMSLGFPYVLVSPALGLFGLVFATAGLLRRGLGAALLAVGAAGVGLTLNPPLLGLIGRLPLVHYVYPMYGWSLVALPLTQAAGRGVALLTKAGERRVVLAALAVVAAGAASLFFVYDLMPGSVLAFPVRTVFLDSLHDWTGRVRFVLPLVVVPLVVIALVAGARTRFAQHCAFAATAVAVLELLLSLAPTAWFADSTVLGSPPSPRVRFLQKVLGDGQYRMLGSPLSVGLPATASLFGLTDVRGAAELPAERYVRYLEAIRPKAPWYVWQYPGDVLRHPLLDLGGVRFVVRGHAAGSDPEPLLNGDAALRLAYHDAHIAIYENDAALPRARIVHASVSVGDASAAFQRLVDAAAAGDHARDAGLADRVFLEPSADGHVPADTPAASMPLAETVRIVPGDDPDQVELEASLAKPGWVVLADTFYPGWTATIDGAPVPIHPANLLFRAVYVPAGAHRIVFRYQPLALRLGLLLALIGIAVCGAILIRAGAGTRAGSFSAPATPPVS